MSAAVLALADQFEALRAPDPWRAAFDAWSLERGLSAEVRRAVVVELLRRRVFAATERHARRRRA